MPPSATRPEPKRSTVEGSGTGLKGRCVKVSERFSRNVPKPGRVSRSVSSIRKTKLLPDVSTPDGIVNEVALAGKFADWKI